jgi:hypothetical protein
MHDQMQSTPEEAPEPLVITIDLTHLEGSLDFIPGNSPTSASMDVDPT